MSKRILIKNANIVSRNFNVSDKFDIYIENGVIFDIAPVIDAEDAEIIDAEGLLVMPGCIDMYSKICESGYENKNNIITISKSATSGGFTSIISSPNSQPVVDNKTVVEYVYKKTIEQAEVNIFPYASMTKGCAGEEVAEIGEMVKAGAVGLSDGSYSILDAELMRNICLYSKMLDVPVVTFCEDRNLSKNGVMNDGIMSTKLGLIGIPNVAEDIIVSRNLLLAQSTGAKLHITHVTTKGAVELIRQGKESGINVTASTCPHYFTLSENVLEGYNTFAKVSPPLRTQEDIEAIKEGLADGTIDAIATGHTPVSIERKLTEFDNAAFGISSLEISFPVSYTELVETGVLSINQFSEKLSSNPAKILGLDKKGSVKKGNDADIIIVDTKNEFEVYGENFLSRAKYSPYDNKKVKGKTVFTIVKGKIFKFD